MDFTAINFTDAKIQISKQTAKELRDFFVSPLLFRNFVAHKKRI